MLLGLLPPPAAQRAHLYFPARGPVRLAPGEICLPAAEMDPRCTLKRTFVLSQDSHEVRPDTHSCLTATGRKLGTAMKAEHRQAALSRKLAYDLAVWPCALGEKKMRRADMTLTRCRSSSIHTVSRGAEKLESHEHAP